MACARDWDATEMAERIVELVTAASSPIEPLAEVQEIPEEVDLTKALMIRRPVVRFKDNNTRVSFVIVPFEVVESAHLAFC